MLKRILLIMLMLSVSTSVLANIGVDIGIVEVHGAYDVTIRAYCYLEDYPVNVSITKDGTPTGFKTPYTFVGLEGSHTFTVPATDDHGESFTRWSNGVSSTTITVTGGGTFSAYYHHYYAYIRARDITLGTWETISITMDGSPTGYTSPHNFTQLTGSHTFTAPEVSPDNHPLAYNTWYEAGAYTSPTVTIDGLIQGNGNQTAQYAAYSFAARFANGTAVSVGVQRQGDPTVHTTPYTYLGIYGSQTFNVSWTTSTGIPFKQWDAPYNEVIQPVLTVNRGQLFMAIYEAYNVTINAYSRTMGGAVGVNVRQEPAGPWYTTPHNFAGLSGIQSFRVAAADPNGNPFSIWDSGAAGTTLTILPWQRRPSYTAYYEAITIKAFSWTSGSSLSVPIYKNGTATGFNTPHTFLSLLPPWNFTVPLLNADGHPFQWWSDGVSDTTNTVTRGGNLTAYYRLPSVVYVDPPYIQGARDATVTASVKIYNLTDGWVWNPSVNPPLLEPLGNLYGASVKVSWDTSALEFVSREPHVPVETWPDGVLHSPVTQTKNDWFRDDYVNALAISGSYLYVGGGQIPGKIEKIDLTNWAPVANLTLGSGENYVNALVVDGGYLYAGLGAPATTGKIVKIDLATFTKVSTLTLSAGENTVRALAVYGTDLYAGLYTTPGKVAKIALGSFTKTSTLDLSTGENNVAALAVYGTDLFAGLYLSPGRVVKIALGSFTRSGALTLNTNENQVSSLAVSGSNLYAGLYSAGASGDGLNRVVKINPAVTPPTRVGGLPFTTGENNVAALAVSGTDLYAGCYVNPGRVVKVNLNTFTRTTALTLPTGEGNVKALAVTGTDLYAGLYTVPMRVAKIALASFTHTSTLARNLPPYECTFQSQFNATSGLWALPFNNDSLTNHPTYFRVTFKILKANTPITLTLSEIILQVPPAGYANATGGQPFNRPDISRFIMHSQPFNLNDLAALKAAYGSTPASPNWNANYDFTRDNIIGAQDLRLLGKCFGKRN